MTSADESFLDELRLFLESVCCDLCRFEHAERDGVAPEAVHIRQELTLAAGAWADIHVTPPGSPPYFVEVDYGYSAGRLLESVRRKYGPASPDPTGATRLVLVIDTQGRPDWPALEAAIRAVLRPELALEVWDEARLRELVSRRFGVDMGSFEQQEDLLALRAAIDRAKMRHAFDDTRSALAPTLLWYLGFWRLRQLRDAGRKSAEAILAPGLYPNVAVVLADQILDSGGMLYQFLGDSVIAFFGMPERTPDDVSRAMGCARALLDIGASVATEWQRQIDRVQAATGMHVAVTIGDIQLVSFQPFGQAHFGCVGDSINLAARLNGLAGTGEIVVSNSLYQRLPETTRGEFAEMEPVEAKNWGRVRAWKRGVQ